MGPRPPGSLFVGEWTEEHRRSRGDCDLARRWGTMLVVAVDIALSGRAVATALRQEN